MCVGGGSNGDWRISCAGQKGGARPPGRLSGGPQRTRERVIEGQSTDVPVTRLGGDGRRSAYRNLLRSRNYRNYFVACLTSSLGDWTGFVALQALVSSLYSDNPRFALFGLGGVMMARLLPSVIIGPISGVLADRYDRKRLMVAVDVMRGTLFIFVAFSRTLTSLFLLTFAVECLSLLYLAAKDATLPQIVPKRDLTEANQLNLLLAYGTLPAGAVIVTIIATVMGAFGFDARDATVAALLVDAVTFFLGAAFMSRLRLTARREPHAEAADRPGVVEELREGLRFIQERPIIRSLIVGVVGVFFGAGVVVAVGPEFVRSSLARPATDWSQLVSVVGGGLIGGILLAPPLARGDRSKERLFPLTLAMTGAFGAVMSFVPSFLAALALGALLGVTAGLSFVFGYTLIQEYTTDDVRARTFAAFYTSTRIALFSSLGIAPFFAGAISGSVLINGVFLRLSGIRIAIFLGAMFALYSALTALRGMYRALREQDNGPLRIPTSHVARTAGVFVAFEGVEGCGKSTQIQRLARTLKGEGRDVVVTREPGGPPVAERIREVLLDPNSGGMDKHTEALLYAAARAEHVHRVIAPALEDGKVVLCDRFLDSSVAYQGYARGLGEREVLEVNRWAVEGLVPDVVVLLDLDAEEGLARIHQRRHQAQEPRSDGATPLRRAPRWREHGIDRLEAEGLEFHRRVAAGYRELARRDRGRFVVVDGSGDVATVARQVRAALHPWLRLPTPEKRGDPTPEAGSA
ncbi:MAG: dTMP kinase [Nitriliruptorales bacterium]|nr:dTMP kinase [Nitriliruptorales bacterium]